MRRNRRTAARGRRHEAFSRHFFGGQPAVDAASVSETNGTQPGIRDPSAWYAMPRYFDLKKAVEPMIYEPAYRDHGQAPPRAEPLAVRTTETPARIAAAISPGRAAYRCAVTVIEARTMEDNLNRELVQERFVATLGRVFRPDCLCCLAAMGLYGVMSQAVTRRTREIGFAWR